MFLFKYTYIHIYIYKHTHDSTTLSKKVLKKAILLQPWTGPEGSRRLRLPDFKTVGT